MTHTQGPWKANQSELAAHSPLVEIRTAPNGDYKICECDYQNARLIAACPALLEALKSCKAYVDCDSPRSEVKNIERIIDEALRLAEGGKP